jgi:16S rRNA (uracil1498-N3)-methyltransferase
MALPYFYIPDFKGDMDELTLDEDTSKHLIQVLRMHPGEALRLTDGKGSLLTAVILDDHRKRCRVTVTHSTLAPPRTRAVTIAISPLKNASRFEWFLEKAVEIGVSRIIPLLCGRTERQSVRMDRLKQIVVSAMLQSQQAWLPDLDEPMEFDRLLSSPGAIPSPALAASQTGGPRFIAHCLEEPRATASLAGARQGQEPAPGGVVPASLTLIGPEGDFTPAEVEMALAAGYLPVSLGPNRLRTETAGIVAATLLCLA